MVIIAQAIGALVNSNNENTLNTSGHERTQKIQIAEVLSDFPVGFSLITHKGMQFVAYYDAKHRMTVASRHLNETEWTYKILDSSIGWDSHNYITMKFDKEDYLHLSGNMHVSPLVYYRTEKPLDITSFKKINYMTGQNEKRTTYPHFMDGPEGSFLFHYRDGKSGNGNEIYNVYDYSTKSWKRYIDKPLTDGKDLMNAYMEGPLLGPDKYYHLVWVWRNTIDCSTNHHLSYAKSKDLINWESVDGKKIELPISISDTCLWVDPIPVNGGIINGAAKMGFDSKKNVIITYHKHDKKGNTQGYVTRFENGIWNIQPLSNWDYRWDFKGGGSLGGFHISIKPARVHSQNTLKIEFDHIKKGKGFWLINERTLQPEKEYITEKTVKQHYSSVTNNTNKLKMYPKTASDSGSDTDKDYSYRIEWETYPANRDTMRTAFKAEPSTLFLIKEKKK